MADHTCAVSVPFLGRICGLPADGIYRRACVHEHMRDGYVCADHVEMVEYGLCLPCFELDGHYCPITLTAVEVTHG